MFYIGGANGWSETTVAVWTLLHRQEETSRLAESKEEGDIRHNTLSTLVFPLVSL